MANRCIKILAPKTMIEGWRIWVLAGNAWRELSQVNGDGHGAAFLSAFDTKDKAIQAARRYYSGAGA